MERFGSTSFQYIDKNIIKSGPVPKNTVKTKKSIWNQFQIFCEEKRYVLDDKISTEDIGNILTDWACNMRKNNGDEYKPSVIKTLWNVTAKLVQERYSNEYGRIIDPFEGADFKTAREARNSKRKLLKAIPSIVATPKPRNIPIKPKLRFAKSVICKTEPTCEYESESSLHIAAVEGSAAHHFNTETSNNTLAPLIIQNNPFIQYAKIFQENTNITEVPTLNNTSKSSVIPKDSLKPTDPCKIKIPEIAKHLYSKPPPGWDHFAWTNDEGMCNYCMTVIKCKKGSTTELARHLLFKHGIQLNKTPEVNPAEYPTPAKKIKVVYPSVKESIKTQTLSEIVARLAAVDGFAVKGIANSSFIHESLSKQNMTLPNTEAEVLNLILQFYAKIQANMISMFLLKKEDGIKFSITLDEIIDIRQRCFIVIHVRYAAEDEVTKKVCLGILPIDKSRSPEHIVELVQQRLSEYGLSLQCDILTSTTNDATTMMEYNFLAPTMQHFCYNQVIKQAVVDSLFDKSRCESTPDELTTFLNPEIEPAILRVRAIINYFNQMPEQNSQLQEFVIEEHGEERQLIIDTPTKWNTLEVMVSRFLLIKISILKALEKLDRCDLWNESDIMVLTKLHRTLELVRLSIEALNRSNINLFASEGVFKFLFNSLNRNTKLNKTLFSSLKSKLRKRRSSEIVSLFKYLQNPQILEEDEEDSDVEFFEMSPKSSLINLAIQILSRLGYQNLSEIGAVTSNSQPGEPSRASSQPATSTSTSLADELEKSISQCYKKKTNKNSSINDNFEYLQREFNLFEITGNLTPTLQKVYDVLKTIAPTSTEIEKIFDVGDNYDQDIISANSNVKLTNALFVLKSYFANE